MNVVRQEGEEVHLFLRLAQVLGSHRRVLCVLAEADWVIPAIALATGSTVVAFPVAPHWLQLQVCRVAAFVVVAQMGQLRPIWPTVAVTRGLVPHGFDSIEGSGGELICLARFAVGNTAVLRMWVHAASLGHQNALANNALKHLVLLGPVLHGIVRYIEYCTSTHAHTRHHQ